MIFNDDDYYGAGSTVEKRKRAAAELTSARDVRLSRVKTINAERDRTHPLPPLPRSRAQIAAAAAALQPMRPPPQVQQQQQEPQERGVSLSPTDPAALLQQMRMESRIAELQGQGQEELQGQVPAAQLFAAAYGSTTTTGACVLFPF